MTPITQSTISRGQSFCWIICLCFTSHSPTTVLFSFFYFSRGTGPNIKLRSFMTHAAYLCYFHSHTKNTTGSDTPLWQHGCKNYVEGKTLHLFFYSVAGFPFHFLFLFPILPRPSLYLQLKYFWVPRASTFLHSQLCNPWQSQFPHPPLTPQTPWTLWEASCPSCLGNVLWWLGCPTRPVNKLRALTLQKTTTNNLTSRGWKCIYMATFSITSWASEETWWFNKEQYIKDQIWKDRLSSGKY